MSSATTLLFRGEMGWSLFMTRHDLAACRRLVEQLNVALARPGAALKPDPLPADLKVTYAKELGLTPQEIEEIARGEFTPLDAAALEEAFLFRELAKALDVAAQFNAQTNGSDRHLARQEWFRRAGFFVVIAPEGGQVAIFGVRGGKRRDA